MTGNSSCIAFKPRRLPGARGSNKGTGSKPGVPDESTAISATSSEGTSAKPGVPDEDKDITEKSDTQHNDDKDDETEFDEDDIYKYKIRVRKDEDVEMKDVEVEGSDKVSIIKDSADANVISLLDIPIQHETPQIQSPSVQKIPVSVIPEITNLPHIPEIITETLVTTADPLP
ncbi:hypothetical protein Tco_0381238 [Tanacetum coccineum]